LRQLANATHGRYYHAPTASQLKDLYASLSAEMHKEYQVTYKSPRPTYDGTRRRIEVTVLLKSGGTTTGGSSYLEEHLINVRSTPLVGLVLLIPLLIALAVPAVVQRGRGAEEQGSKGAGDKGRNGDTEKRRITASPPLLVSPSPPLPGSPAPLPAGTSAPPACPHCGNPVRPGARFCSRCSQPLTPPSAASPGPVANTCPRCGTAVRPGARFCGSCGFSMGGAR